MKVVFVLLVAVFFPSVSALGDPSTVYASIKPLTTQDIRKMITSRLQELQRKLKEQEAALDRLNDSDDVNDVDQERAFLTNEHTLTMNEISRISDLNVGSFLLGITNRSALYQNPPPATPENIALLEKLSSASEMERQIILISLKFPNKENQEELKTVTQAFFKKLLENLDPFQLSDSVAVSLKSRRNFDHHLENLSYELVASDIWYLENPPDYAPRGQLHYHGRVSGWPCGSWSNNNYWGWGWGGGWKNEGWNYYNGWNYYGGRSIRRRE